MNWVKNNIGLVVGGVVALALMGVAGWFLYTQMEAEKKAQASLDQGLSNLKTLLTRDPHPGDPDRGVDNIAAVKSQHEKVKQDLLEPLQSLFKPFEFPQDLNTFKFKSLLEDRVAALQRAARSSGTGLPKEGESRYSFSFSGERAKVSFAPETLEPMAFQLAQIEALSQVLFDSKVYSINAIKRPEVTEAEEEVEEDEDDYDDEETSFSSFSLGFGGEDFIEETAITNEITGAIIYPFQLSFQCFARELSDVMTRFDEDEHFFRIKWMVVEQSAKSTKSMDPNASLYAPEPGRGMMGGMDPSLAARYGMAGGGDAGRYGGGGRYGGAYGGGRYGGMSGMSGAAGYGASDEISMEDLEEKPLTVNMLVEVISIPPPAEESEEDMASGDMGYQPY